MNKKVKEINNFKAFMIILTPLGVLLYKEEKGENPFFEWDEDISWNMPGGVCNKRHSKKFCVHDVNEKFNINLTTCSEITTLSLSPKKDIFCYEIPDISQVIKLIDSSDKIDVIPFEDIKNNDLSPQEISVIGNFFFKSMSLAV